MKKIFKRAMALILVAVMTFSAVPLSGFEAKASGLTGYSAGAAAKWGRDHINDVWSPLLGYGIWENGGDCANYVSQCLYMGGLDMTGAWHSNGCMRYYAALSDGVFIRAQQLHDYLVSIGGQSIRNPSADQLSLGDVLFFKRSGAARCTHSAIVIDFENGQPVIGYHSILNKAGVYEIGRTTDIDLDFMRENTYLVKLNGSICTAQKSRDFDVYIANKSTGLYSSAGGYGFIRNVIGSDYIHVYSTQYANGSTWGYTFCRGYWGWVKIADCNYQTHVSTPEVNHKFGGWYVAKPATCLTSGYEQRDCTVCGFSQQRTITGGHLVKEHATCLTPGFCSICGAAVEEALGHDFGDWSFITEPTCTEGGVRTHICKRCGFEEQEEVAPLGHDDIHVSTPPSCTDIGTAMYECQRCGRTIANYINSENTVTDWTPEVIDGLKPVETKIQYSYRDKSFTSSYGTGIDGWTQYSYEWVQSGSGSANYVNSWPYGWSTSDWHYINFRVGPFSPYETEIAKREVANSHIGYLNAHWCRGEYSSVTDRLISQTYTTEFDTFHAFGSYENFATSITKNAYKHLDRNYCDDTHWWELNLQTPYYWSTYTDYNKLFHYYKWSDWSGWTDEEISVSDTREVQTRTVYKYNLAALGHDFSVVDSQKDPTCTEPGYIGKSCSRCGAISPDAEIIPAPGHELYDEISERGWHKTSEENGIITWRRDCQRFCGYYEEKQENGECVFELKEIVESTCEEEGKIISVCKYHNEEKIEIIKAKGHEPDNNWITVYGPTCANGGKDGKEICYCVRHDNGKTCSKVFERIIPAPDHVVVKDPPVSPTCTETGYKEGSHCDVCKEILVEQQDDPALGHEPDNNWIVVEEPGCDKDGKEICYCVRHDDGVTCNKIYERPIPGKPATYKEIKRVESSCAECGYIEYTCINCEGTENEHGYTEPLPLDPNGHAEGVWKTLQEAQICEIPGIEVSECPLCGEMLDKKEIPPQYEKHNMVKEVIKSSCTTSGITNEYCTQCGLTLDPVDDDPLGHDLGDWVVEKEATCTEHGEKRQYCQRDGCSYYITEPIAPIGHDYKVSQVIAPLCEEIGKTVYVCQNDSSHTFEGDFVPALCHEPDGNWIVTKEPDCTNKGTEQCDCVRHDDGVTCDTVFMRDIEIDPDAHDWGDWFVDADPNCVDKGIEKRICNINNEHIQTKETVTDPDNHDMGEWYEVTKATCTEKGLEKRDCNRCDYSEERETAINPDNHYAETYYTVDEKADCENDGKKSHHCERCDKSLDEVVISKRNHVYDNGVETKAPTCTEDGVKTFTCTNEETNEYKACTHSYTEVIPATDHDWGNWETVTPATCEAAGLERRICKNDASHVEENVLTAIGHKWDDGVIDPDSTCNTHGTKTFTCQNDASHTKTEEVPLDENNHVGDTYTKDNKDATCTENGYTGDIYCSDCDKKLSDGNVIPALGHDMGEWYEVTKATCTEKGLEKRDCNRCDYSEKRETAIDPDNHYAETFYTVDEKADCENDGKKSHHCERCDKSLDEVVISKRNHVYDNGVETKAPTCTEDGVKTFTCTNEETNEYKACTHSYTEVISALGHDMGEWYEVTKATCTEKGIEKRDCNRCDYYEERETAINPDNHYAETFYTVDEKADCENDGKKSHHCERCDKSLDEVVISKRNHAYDDGVETTAPTCTEDGVKTFTCTNEETNEYKVCTHSYTEVIPATGHDWGEWKIIPGKEPTIYEKGRERCICNNDSSHIQERDVDKLESRVAYFIVADENGDFEYEGKKYTLVDTVRFALGTTVIINPDVPEMEGYYGYWEDYTISDKDLYIEAKYELKSGDNQSDLVSDKNVVYKDGVATITLSAFAETLNAKVPMGATPYDIVLVLDQSSSMEREFGSDKTASNYNNSRIKVLKDVAISFIQTVYDSSVENNVDHRMAIVGFSGTEYSYKNTGLLTPSGTVKTFDKLTDKDYASAFVDVRVQKNILDASINNMVIKTGTAADYGMQMARQVLANNRNSEREKLVLFITDGEPADVQGRNYWPFSKPIANDTIDYANQIKQEYDATIYSVGVAAGADPDDETKDLNIYLHNVSSNYPDAKSMTEKGKASPMKNYFLTAEDKDAVSKAFESIVAQKITNTISFTKVNFYDTISEYFTLTTENENALRQSVKEKYGVTDRDIIITRNADGTTTVRINNLIPKPVFDENNMQTGYGVTVDFDVTANEKTLDGGTFLTNNENAGIEHDGKTVIDFKIPEGEVISSGRAIVEFRIGDEVYAIREVNIGDNVIVPETDVADWIITEGATITSDYTVFNAEYTTESNTVEWIIGDEKITETYHTGEIIRIPEIDVPENKIFTGWSTSVPYRMPAYALSFTAVFKSHEHNFSEQDKQGDCVSGIVHIFTCDCGYSYTTQDSPAKHSYTANVHLVNNESVATMTCSVCGAAESSVINYKAQYNQFGSSKVVDLTLHDNKGISVQPDGYIYIKIAEDQKVLSNAKTGKLVVTRVNADNSTDKIPYLKNGSADSVGYYVEGSYIILKLDHFSYYVMTIPEEDGQIPSFGKIECSFNGHNYESVITVPTCTTEGYTTHTCTSCGDVYTDAETGITEHIYENNICIHCGEVKEINCSHACHKNGFIGFIWKIFNFIFRIFGIESERFCDCGADHW